VTTQLKNVTLNLPDSLERVPSEPETETTTGSIAVPDDVRETIRRVSYVGLLDDLQIAVEVQMRDAQDTGVRIPLDEFLESQGFDPEGLAD
jgi:hypothetical protein